MDLIDKFLYLYSFLLKNYLLHYNKNWNQHGKDDYNENDDVLRIDVTPEISEEITEQLIYQVEKLNDKEGIISLSREKVSVSFPFMLSK